MSEFKEDDRSPIVYFVLLGNPLPWPSQGNFYFLLERR